MQPLQSDHADDRRLRLVFSNAVVSLSLTADVTLEEIAQKLGAFPIRRYGHPLAIDVILESRGGERVRNPS